MNTSAQKAMVIIPENHPNPPETHEIEAAWILARHFKCIVEFIIPLDDYKRKTPDILMNGRVAEIKSPEGNSRKNTIRNQFDRANKQLANDLVIDSRSTKLDDKILCQAIEKELQARHRIKRVILIKKDAKVLVFEK
jgi:hypothetical protein